MSAYGDLTWLVDSLTRLASELEDEATYGLDEDQLRDHARSTADAIRSLRSEVRVHARQQATP